MSATPGAIVRKGGITRTVFIISLVVVAAVSGVGGYLVNGILHPSTAPANVTLNGAGSTFIYPLLSAMSVNYSRANPSVAVNYQSIGSGGGITALEKKTVDFAASDRPLNAQDKVAAPDSLHIPATIGSVVFAYNLPNIPKGMNITGPILAQIFSGSIHLWNNATLQSINPGLTLPNQPMTVVHRSDGSGTTFIWTSYLSLVSPAWNATVGAGQSVQWPTGIGASGNEGVAGVIRGTTYFCGYVELAYALQNSMTYAYVLNHDGTNYVAPSLATTSYAVQNSTSTLPAGNGDWSHVSLLNAPGAQSYPIASFSYIMVYQELNVLSGYTNTQATGLVNFLWFVVHGGQALSPSLGYVPLPQSVVTLDETSIKSITLNGQIVKS